MKHFLLAIFLIVCIGTIGAADLESYEFINCLLNLPGPSAPVIFDDAVIFTAPSSYRRVGISFAYEGFSKVYWMQKLMVDRKDTGILFHVQTIPDNIPDLDYRMVIDGLWTADPLNPLTIRSAGSAGISLSRVSLPAKQRPVPTVDPVSGLLRLSFNAPPGETVTVGGSFNNWDPFMYEMKESRAGLYTLTLSLPAGSYQYVFFHRGTRYLDPNNNDKVYTKDGKTASHALIR